MLDIADFTKNNKNTSVVELKDDSMAPVFEESDYAGGMTSERLKIDGMNAIIKFNGEILIKKILQANDKTLIVTTLKDMLSGKPPEKIELENLDDIYAIIWYRKHMGRRSMKFISLLNDTTDINLNFFKTYHEISKLTGALYMTYIFENMTTNQHEGPLLFKSPLRR